MTKQDLIIEPDDFPAFLKGRFPGGVVEIAAKLGVGQKMVYFLLAGKRKPSAKILHKCGLEVVYRAVPPEKPKR